MDNHNPDATPSRSCENQREQNYEGALSWYVRLSDEKRAEYNHKRRTLYKENKAAAMDRVNHEQVSQACASSLLGVRRTTFSNVTNTLDNDMCTAPTSASTDHQTEDTDVVCNKDTTSTPDHIHGNENPTCVIIGDQNSKKTQSWYARLSDEKRAEYNQKRRAIYREKKAATINRVNHEQMTQSDASSLPGVQRTPFSNITNTLENASGSTGHQTSDVSVGSKKRNAQGWYARLSKDKNTEHCDQLRMARLHKKTPELNVGDAMPHYQPSQLSGGTNCTAAISISVDRRHVENYVGCSRQFGHGIDQHESAQCGDNHMLNPTSTVSAMDEDTDIDWLHSNPTYQRRPIPVRDESHISVIEGMHFQESYLPNLVASSEKKRRRMKDYYAGMTGEEKDIVLRRMRAYKMGTRHTLPLSDNSCISQAASGSAIPSSSTSAIHRQPFRQCNRIDEMNSDEESDVAGIFEPTEPDAEVEETLHNIQDEQPIVL